MSGEANDRNGGLGTLNEWACFSPNPNEPLVPPAIGRRLRGILSDGRRIKTNPVARADGLEVTFVNGNWLTLGTPHGDYQKAIDRKNSGKPGVDWRDPFRNVPEATGEASVTTLVGDLRRELAAERKQKQEPATPAPRRWQGLSWLFTWPGALASRLRGGDKKKKKKKPQARAKGPSALPGRMPIAQKKT